MTKCRSLVIGGGFFGMYIAEHLKKAGHSVTLCEKNDDFMQRASYNNQARVHNGYHYPRSTLTALRSKTLFPVFCEEFPDCIDSSFAKYYMIGKILGKVSARQFKMFCRRLGLQCEEAPVQIRKLTNPHYIEETFSTVEYAFNANILKEIMHNRLEEAGVDIRLQTEVVSLVKPGERFAVTLKSNNITQYLEADQVFNCTYSRLNFLLTQSGLEIIPLKQEMTEMCLIEVPDVLQKIGLTIMCGPFFSIMPFPDRNLHSFSHVRYTPHYEWYDSDNYLDTYQHFAQAEKKSAYKRMLLDGIRYIPCLKESVYKESLWEVKTVLPRSEIDDSRPILFKANYGYEGLHCIIGGKIDNIYDVIEIIKKKGLDQ